MSLPPGSKVGIYEVVELIGVGGMGEVYRARDSRLDRAVAIKTLPDEFAADPDRLARFEREAKVLAQLNHPHIASIYGLEPGTPVALAMEMAEGETLSHRILSGPLPIEDAVIIARQIAEALEHAHAKNIVHRDLKPANIKIGARDSDPHVKVLDFGLAKAMSTDAGSSGAHPISSPTITSPANLTRAGVVLGTAAYMAPEQARGRNVDHRADIWAFGCVLFEMLTGHRAFEGDEVADVLARVIQSDPDWSHLPATTPPSLRTLLRRCLRKDAHQRVHSIADVRIELEEIGTGSTPGVQQPASPNTRRSWLPAIGGLAVGAAVTALVFLWLTPARPAMVPAPVLRFRVSAPDGWHLYRTPNNGRLAIALSPDGEKLAAVMVSKDAQQRILVRRLDESAFRELPGSDGATAVFWAPDSSRIAFSFPGGLRQADLTGSGSSLIASIPGFVNGSWSRQDMIVASRASLDPLFAWPASSNQPARIGTVPDGVVARVLPRWLPDGTGFLFADGFGSGEWFLRMQRVTGESVDIKPFQSTGAGSVSLDYESGHFLLANTEPSGRTALTAQPFNPVTLALTGEPMVIATDLNVAFAASDSVLAFGEARFVQEHFVWLDAAGRAVSEVLAPRERVSNFDLSHDERFVVFQQATTIMLHDIVRGVTSMLAPIGADPIFSPDDRQVAFSVTSAEGGLYVMPAFGGERRRIFSSKVPAYTEDWSRDGHSIAAVSRPGHVIVIPASGQGPSIEIPAGAEGATLDEPHFSPDGRWLAFGQSRQATNEVFLTALPPTGERWQLSVGGGAQPRWRDDGRAVYFMATSGNLMVVDVILTPGVRPEISAPRLALPAGIQVQPTLDQYALSKDRRRVLVRRTVENSSVTLDDLQVIVNWPSLLKTNGARQE